MRMSRRFGTPLAAFVVLWFFSGSAHAGLLRLSTVSGSVSSHAEVTPGGSQAVFDDQGNSADSYADFPIAADATVVNGQDFANGLGSLDGAFNGGMVQGNGSSSVETAAGGGDSAFGMADTVFSMTFTTTEDLDYAFEWGIFSDGSDSVGSASLVFEGSHGTIFSMSTPPTAFGDEGVETGILAPGTYTISATTHADFNADEGNAGNASGDYYFHLGVVPEPASIMLLMLGAMTVARRKR